MSDANLGLFENDRQTNLESTVAMIEDVLVELGHFINECRTEPAGARLGWRLKSGSAYVTLTLVDRDDFTHLRAAATVMNVSSEVDQAALYRRLLELNESELCGVGFALKRDQVCIVAERSTLDLDRSEVRSLVRILQDSADKYDDALVAEFGGSIGGPPAT